MQVDDMLLSKLEKLSFLKIADDKRDEIISQLSEIVNFVDNLSLLDTQNVDEKFAMSDDATLLREDVAFCDTSINESIIKNAPLSSDNFFVVPKIIE
ncbi:MAG TPA: Asp-tRNA(Asn)/Glu-tRNA(Gln) amidotransferase subunit GatC [Sulfurimonas sp.]|uniref:Asp-tRNA(Asn)/Glu-tRNA(Gln) amidotransferase subunit GatC n=1 Tax=Sulfurimonas sp. TaxID=2022749 RepID=UPI002B714639|nr:Asp-tRNA(Asn)/Glu-tRNA(Gln) amidotransferase subunit GatC [Sulfurimonas sp.]HUH43297.1 Asp-tRNA(Asn)/Glu-tRNA(Gln) amidotransferase subunit GatC [Sulfurimonas sp.]